MQEDTLYMDRDSQIRAIEKTFEDNKKPIEKHYSKPNVVPVEISSIFPDFKVSIEIMNTILCIIDFKFIDFFNYLYNLSNFNIILFVFKLAMEVPVCSGNL